MTIKRYAIMTYHVPAVVRGTFSICIGSRRCPDGWLTYVSGPADSCAADVLEAYAPDGCFAAVRVCEI